MITKSTIKTAVLFILSTALSSQVFAEVKLNLGEGIRLIAVNGEEINKDSFFSDSSNITLQDGTHQILVNYTAEIKPGDDSELEITQPSVILFNASATELVLTAPPMKSLRDVEDFEKKLNWSLINKNGKPVDFKANLLIKEGFQFSRDYEDELEDFNMSSAESALPKTKILSPAEVRNTDRKNQAQNNNNMAMDMLIYWYNQADEKTRRSFKELISK